MALTQGQLIAALAEASGGTKASVKAAFEALQTVCSKEDKVATPIGIFKKKKTPAKPSRQGRNPFTGEMVTFKAKPASVKLVFRPNKATKERVAKGK